MLLPALPSDEVGGIAEGTLPVGSVALPAPDPDSPEDAPSELAPEDTGGLAEGSVELLPVLLRTKLAAS